MNFDMSKLMQQAQKIQEQMKKSQEDLENMEVTGESGAGLVKITMNGKYGAKSIFIDDSILNEDKEMLEDLIVSAINSAVNQIAEKSKNNLSGLTDGLEMPAGMKFPF